MAKVKENDYMDVLVRMLEDDLARAERAVVNCNYQAMVRQHSLDALDAIVSARAWDRKALLLRRLIAEEKEYTK